MGSIIQTLVKLKILCKSKISQTYLTIICITIVIKLLGYFEKLLIAYFWGTGYKSDIYNALSMFVLSFFFLFREIVEPGYMNRFTLYRELGKIELANNLFSTSFIFLFLISLIISCGIFFFSNNITKIILPGFEGIQIYEISSLLRIGSLVCLFSIITSITQITLTVYKRFVPISISELFFRLSTVLFTIFLSRVCGITGVVIGLVVGVFFRFVFQLFILYNQTPSRIKLSSVNLKSLDGIWGLTWPILIGILFSYLTGILDNSFASYMPIGSLSALNYAKKIAEFPIVIFPYTLSVILFPYFTEFYIKNKIRDLHMLLLKTIVIICIVFIPLSLAVYMLSDEIVRLVLQRGSFDLISTQLTFKPLQIYALSIPAMALETILVVFYFSTANTKTPVLVGILCSITHVILAYIFIESIGYIGIAYAFFISRTIKIGVLFFLLKSNRKRFENK